MIGGARWRRNVGADGVGEREWYYGCGERVMQGMYQCCLLGGVEIRTKNTVRG